MTGAPSKMPDDFDRYFEKWLNNKATQKGIARELSVSQSAVSDWIRKLIDETGRDRNLIGTPEFEGVLSRYNAGELSTRQAGAKLGIAHTQFGNLRRRAMESRAFLPDPEEAPQQSSLSSKVSSVKESSAALESNRENGRVPGNLER